MAPRDTRAARAEVAQETLSILGQGAYVSTRQRRRVDVADALARAVHGSFTLRGEDPLPAEPSTDGSTTRAPRLPSVELSQETTLAALYRLAAAAGPEASERTMLLNFASAKNPGGGFRKGSQAQEESIARSSGLYPCLVQFEDGMYAENARNPRGCLYADHMIFSPCVPFFRGDDGLLLDEPVTCSVITAPAVNLGAARGAAIRQATPVMRQRLRRVLRLAHAQGLQVLILGAWGCGVFGNLPRDMAELFREALELPEFAGAFTEVHFAIPDPACLAAFQRVLAPLQQGAVPQPEREEAGADMFEDRGQKEGEDEARGGRVVVEITSFGYMSGLGQPAADVVFSARHIANPHGGPKTHLSGLDARLRKEVMHCHGAADLLQQIRAEALRRAEECVDEGPIRIAVGCDRGKHRSVTLCIEAATDLKRVRTSHGRKLDVRVRHREQDTWAGTAAGQGQRAPGGRGRGKASRGVRVAREQDEIEAEEALDQLRANAAGGGDSGGDVTDRDEPSGLGTGGRTEATAAEAPRPVRRWQRSKAEA